MRRNALGQITDSNILTMTDTHLLVELSASVIEFLTSTHVSQILRDNGLETTQLEVDYLLKLARRTIK